MSRSDSMAAPLHRAVGPGTDRSTPDLEALCLRLTSGLSSETIFRRNEPLAKKTTLRVGGPADFYAEPASEPDLAFLYQTARKEKIPLLLLGRGSNLLVRDEGFRGLVICLNQPFFSRIEMVNGKLWCGAGARLKQVCMLAKKEGLGGLEFMEGIPGSVGGALRMNAGAMGKATFEVVEQVRLLDEKARIMDRPVGEIRVQYRSCPLFENQVALGALFRVEQSERKLIEEKLNLYSRKRWGSQPAAASAGCIFKNPSAIPAGKLIEELGLKGRRVGGAVVSDLHGNFIVNEGGASANDILELMEIIREKARSERGIELETEVQIVGEKI